MLTSKAVTRWAISAIIWTAVLVATFAIFAACSDNPNPEPVPSTTYTVPVDVSPEDCPLATYQCETQCPEGDEACIAAQQLACAVATHPPCNEIIPPTVEGIPEDDYYAVFTQWTHNNIAEADQAAFSETVLDQVYITNQGDWDCEDSCETRWAQAYVEWQNDCAAEQRPTGVVCNGETPWGASVGESCCDKCRDLCDKVGCGSAECSACHFGCFVDNPNVGCTVCSDGCGDEVTSNGGDEVTSNGGGPPGWWNANHAAQQIGVAQTQLEDVVIVQRNGQETPEHIRKFLNAELDDTLAPLNKAQDDIDGGSTDAAILDLQDALTAARNFAYVFSGGFVTGSIEHSAASGKVTEAAKQAIRNIEDALTELTPT